MTISLYDAIDSITMADIIGDDSELQRIWYQSIADTEQWDDD